MNLILAVRNNVDVAIDEKQGEIAKAETALAGLRDELHILEDLRQAARAPAALTHQMPHAPGQEYAA